MVEQFGQERFEFILNETQLHQIIKDVKNQFSDLGILYLCKNNEAVIRRTLEEAKLVFMNYSPPSLMCLCDLRTLWLKNNSLR